MFRIVGLFFQEEKTIADLFKAFFTCAGKPQCRAHNLRPSPAVQRPLLGRLRDAPERGVCVWLGGLVCVVGGGEGLVL